MMEGFELTGELGGILQIKVGKLRLHEEAVTHEHCVKELALLVGTFWPFFYLVIYSLCIGWSALRTL